MAKKKENSVEEMLDGKEEILKETVQELEKEAQDADKIENAEQEEQEVPDIETILIKLASERDQYLDMMQRTKAEFDNYRKRTIVQQSQSRFDGTREAVTALLPVLDSMDRALNVACEVGDDDPLKIGLNMIYCQLIESLKNLGMEKIKALGEEFNPDFHHAVMKGEAAKEFKPGCVMEVMQDGYIVKEKVIRYAMVKVAE